jgi:hypothetical protein
MELGGHCVVSSVRHPGGSHNRPGRLGEEKTVAPNGTHIAAPQ